jgi:hypothetical protein
LADALRQERKAIEKLGEQTEEVAAWLRRREHSAGIGGLYGAP